MSSTRQLGQTLVRTTRATNGHHIKYKLYGHLLQRCTDRLLLRQGQQLHSRLIPSGTNPDNFLASKLINFYSKTKQLIYVRHVFDEIPHRNTFSYNALLIAYSAHGRYREALELFSSFLAESFCDVRPDGFTISCILKVMSETMVDSFLGRIVHGYVIKGGLSSDVFVGNGLITYYSKCDDLVVARKFFDEMQEKDLVSWNSMISGYSQSGFYEECKDLFKEMLCLDQELRPDGVTVVSVLQACAQSSDLVLGMEVHRYMIDCGVEMDLSVCNSVIALYAKCGSLEYAKELFDEMSEKDEISYGMMVAGYMVHGFVDEAMSLFKKMRNPSFSTWNAVISGHVQNNRYYEILDLFQKMQASGFRPNSVTLSSILPAISYFSHLKGEKETHGYAIKNSFHRNIYVATAMIDTYAKLGFIDGAKRVFDRTKERSVIVWTAIISAYAAHGQADLAISLFNEMLKSEIKPDPVTFTAVLTACMHGGLVDEAWKIF